MKLSRNFQEIDTKGKQNISKQYISDICIMPFSGYIYFTTTTKDEKAYNFDGNIIINILNRINERCKQKFYIE